MSSAEDQMFLPFQRPVKHKTFETKLSKIMLDKKKSKKGTFLFYAHRHRSQGCG
jgi:hypothetical protein